MRTTSNATTHSQAPDVIRTTNNGGAMLSTLLNRLPRPISRRATRASAVLALVVAWQGSALAGQGQYGWISFDHRGRPPGATASALAYDEARGELVLSGGATSAGFLSTWIRREATWRRLETATQPPERYGAVMVYDAGREETVLFGGYGLSADGGGTIALRDTWVWNGTIWRQAMPPAAPTPRAFAAMAYDRVRGKVVLFGGRGISDTGEPFSYLGDTWTWDGNNWTRESPAVAPAARNSAGMVFDEARGETLLFGGDAGGSSASETWTWDGAAWTQRSPTRAPQARTDFGIAYDPIRQRVVVFSGVDQALFHDTWVWDGSDWTQVTPAEQPEARFSPAAAFDRSVGQVVLYGGHRITYFGADTWGWDGTAWSSLEIPTPLPRIGGAMAYDPVRGRPFLFGGIADPIFGDMWSHAGEWQRESLSLAPPPRSYSAIATDSKRNEVVLFGGLSEEFNALGDTWIWNGSSWRDATPAVTLPPALSPPPRQGTALAYDAVREQIVLFGGWESDVNQLLADTWTWNGTSWELRILAGPPAVKNHAMTYDAARQEVVLYGGIDAAGEIRGETWTWNGAQWSMKSPPGSPPAAAASVMVYDPTVRRVLLFGGLGNPETAVWAWDGSTWTKFDFASAPARRSFSMMTFVPELGGSLLFGGLGSGYRDDTWLLRMPPVQVAAVVSRKTHGAAGPFDINLPLTGAAGVECRSGGADNAHQVVIRFVGPITFVSASVTSGTGSVMSTATSVDSQEVTVNLAGVSNAQTITVTLSNVNDGATTRDISVPMGVLRGDTSADGVVNSADITQVRRQSGQAATAGPSPNFHTDLSNDGVINSADITTVRRQSGTALP